MALREGPRPLERHMFIHRAEFTKRTTEYEGVDLGQSMGYHGI